MIFRLSRNLSHIRQDKFYHSIQYREQIIFISLPAYTSDNNIADSPNNFFNERSSTMASELNRISSQYIN